MRSVIRVREFLPVLFLSLLPVRAEGSKWEKVGKWKRIEIAFAGSSWEGNPFERLFTALFFFPSGRVLRQFGYYAGDSCWKVSFLSDEKGEWRYRTSCGDADLDGHEGRSLCVASGLFADSASCNLTMSR